MPIVSVILPVFNRQVLAERALRSILAQGLRDVEIVIVDDASIEPFRLPCDVNSDNIRILRHSHNRGASAARNSGIASARGEWIAFLDSDDYWLRDTLATRLEHATTNAQPGELVAFAAGFAFHNKRTGKCGIRIPRGSKRSTDFASGCWFAPGSTGLARKEVFDRIGPFDPQLRRLEDLDWFLRFALAGGHLKVWDGMAAIVETGPKPNISVIEYAARLLRAKYLDHGGSEVLTPKQRRRLAAYLEIERASVFASEQKWLKFALAMGRSLRHVPRLTLHLERFWRFAPWANYPSGAHDEQPDLSVVPSKWSYQDHHQMEGEPTRSRTCEP